MGPQENYAVITDYELHHPLAFQIFAKVFGYPVDKTEAMRREFASSLRLVAFCPRDVGDRSGAK
ncbi:MAG: hypothetical protein JOZ19_03235 [Rubrobacter sp.]|nr:hypothetical protein [Rubrobacter sp.]